MINVAVIGAGAICPSHIEAYMTFPDRCRIRAVVDVNQDKADAVIRRYHLQAKAFNDYHWILDDPDIHLVSVCTPPSTHAEISIECLRAGKHVLVEKPMAASLAECDEMIQTAESGQRILSVVAQNRFRTPVAKVRKILETGIVGRILHAQVNSFWWRGRAYYDLWWRGTWQSEGGGCTLNHAVHHIDMLMWMLGLPEELTAVIGNVAHDNAEVEDLSMAILRYPNRCFAQITSSVVHHGEEQEIVFQGERARVSIPWRLCASSAKENGFPVRDEETEREIQQFYDQLPDLQYERHAGQVHDVLTAIESGREVLISGHAGRRTLELITAVYKSATLREAVRLPLPANDPFYTKEGLLQQMPRFYQKERSVTRFHDNSITT